jgi:hypothetical protein
VRPPFNVSLMSPQLVLRKSTSDAHPPPQHIHHSRIRVKYEAHGATRTRQEWQLLPIEFPHNPLFPGFPLRLEMLRAADRYAYRLWKRYLFCRDCLWRETASIYSWRLPRFAGDALPRFTGDALSLHWRSPCSLLAITLSMTPN